MYGDPNSDPKAKRADQERVMCELVAGVSNLLGANSTVMRVESTLFVPILVDGVIRNHPDAEAFIAEGIADFEARLDVWAVGGFDA